MEEETDSMTSRAVSRRQAATLAELPVLVKKGQRSAVHQCVGAAHVRLWTPHHYTVHRTGKHSLLRLIKILVLVHPTLGLHHQDLISEDRMILDTCTKLSLAPFYFHYKFHKFVT
eukprot:scpid42801/ scgid20979/ 